MIENTKVYDYFNSNEFKGLLEELKHKYKTYGSIVGTISVIPKTKEEQEKLSKFLSKNIKFNETNKIKTKDIQKALDESIFEGYTVNDIVLIMYPNIRSIKEIKNEENSIVNSNYIIIKDKYKNSNIDKIFDNEKTSVLEIKKLILKDSELLKNILKSINELPIFTNEILYLPVFSSLKTNNPHYFDLDTHESNIFIKFISYLLDEEYLNTRKSKIELLDKVGIIIDEVSNYCITYNLYGNPMLDSFKNNKTPLNISLANIKNLDNIKAVNNKLLIIENPSFISEIIGKDINYSVIITSGNSNLVIYKIIDKIKNCNIFFNGDFDPEGLVIAQNFKNKFNNMKFIGYNKINFYNGISKNIISDSRLKKLNNVMDKDLNEIKELILKEKHASYQESNYNNLLEEIDKNN